MRKLDEGGEGAKDRKGKKRKTSDAGVKKQRAPSEGGVHEESAAALKKKDKKDKKRSSQSAPDRSDTRVSRSPERKHESPKRQDKGPSQAAVTKDSNPAAGSTPSKSKTSRTAPGLTDLQAKMKQSLDGARFRLINETLYRSDSGHAYQMMREDPEVFEEYHKGFRHQVQSWPANPVSHYIQSLSAYPPKTVIADLGCGDAALAKALVPKGLTVLSFDLVSDGKYVVEADICAKVPLPGSEAAEGEGQVVDVVVCALSLMGTNWPGCIREAWRVLKADGELKIAEVASRFTDVEAFVSLISSVGFKLKSKDDRNTHFTLFEFRKIARKSAMSEKEWSKIMSRGSLLKPCEYKRR